MEPDAIGIRTDLMEQLANPAFHRAQVKDIQFSSLPGNQIPHF